MQQNIKFLKKSESNLEKDKCDAMRWMILSSILLVIFCSNPVTFILFVIPLIATFMVYFYKWAEATDEINAIRKARYRQYTYF